MDSLLSPAIQGPYANIYWFATGGRDLILFKFKEDPLIRFYAVIHSHRGDRRAVLLYGFQAAKKQRQDKRAKGRAEEVAMKYFSTLDYVGGIQ